MFEILAAALLAVIPVQVETSDGRTVRGTLQSATAEALTIQEDGGGQTVLAAEDLISLRSLAEHDATAPSYRVTLLNGSQIAATGVSLTEDQLVIEPRRQPDLKIDVALVKAIRFRAASPTTDPAFLGLVEQEGAGDVMAIRRDEDRLDPYRGVILSIGGGKVVFDLDGQQVDAPIDRLEGLVFGGNRQVQADAKIKVTDIYESTWAVTAIRTSPSGDQLELDLDSDITHTIPLSHIDRMQWSVGLAMLASEKPAEQNFKSYFSGSVNSELLTSWFGPKSVRQDDLSLQGNSWVEYRVDQGFQSFAGSVERDQDVSQAGRATVRILVDGEVRWTESVESDRLGFDLPLADARRVRIELDCEDDGDLGDSVRVIRPRLVK